jgi:hypothetical protein
LQELGQVRDVKMASRCLIRGDGAESLRA